MEGFLCDELLQEVLRRLPSSSSATVSLVSKRWLSALRSSTTDLSLSIPFLSSPPLPSPSLFTVLSHFPNLSSLTLLSTALVEDDDAESFPPPPPPQHMFPTPVSADALLLSVATSPCASRLTNLRFATAAAPVSPAALLSSSNSLTRLTALHLSCISPVSFSWLAGFPSIKSLSLVFCPKSADALGAEEQEEEQESYNLGDDKSRPIVMLPLESLYISGIRAGDRAMSWIWRRCGNLRRLRLRACEGTGDGPSSPFFSLILAGLRELELRACRPIADCVLLRAADHCQSLTSILLHDGGSSDALHHFISQRGAGLCTIDLRLPLDLHNDHLSAIATASAAVGESNSPRLRSLRLQSCCLVTGDGLRAVARASASKAIEELALVSCDVVERDPGLLSFLGQSLLRLWRLDLSYNETLGDKELGAMLSSCAGLVEVSLRGCGQLTDAAVLCLLTHLRSRLEVVDLSRCRGISLGGIERLVLNSGRLSRISVEKEKVSEAAIAMASRRAIQIGD